MSSKCCCQSKWNLSDRCYWKSQVEFSPYSKDSIFHLTQLIHITTQDHYCFQHETSVTQGRDVKFQEKHMLLQTHWALTLTEAMEHLVLKDLHTSNQLKHWALQGCISELLTISFYFFFFLPKAFNLHMCSNEQGKIKVAQVYLIFKTLMLSLQFRF